MNVQRSVVALARSVGGRRRLAVALSLLLGTGAMVASPPAPADTATGGRVVLVDSTPVTGTDLAGGATLVPAIPVGSASADLSSLQMDLRYGVGAAVWLARSGESWQVHAAERLGSRTWGEDVALSVPGRPTEAPVVDVYPDQPEWSRHNELVRDQIAENGGEVVKQTGDGFFASFESPKAAIDAAVGIQRALAEEIVAPDVRIGAHAGDAFRTGSDSSDYGGQGVHVASRIGAAAGAGEILVSAETLDGAGTTYRTSEPRAAELKGLEQPVDVVSVAWR